MPASRGPLEHEVRGRFASRLGVDANADVDTFTAAFDNRMRDERLHGSIATALGLDAFTATGADILAKFDEKLAGHAKALGLPSDATIHQIEAAQAEANKRRQDAAPAKPTATPATRRVQGGAQPSEDEINAAIDRFAATGFAPDGSSSNGRVPGEPSDPNDNPAWR